MFSWVTLYWTEVGTPSVLFVTSDENLENVRQVVGEKTRDLPKPWRFLSLWTSKMLAHSSVHKAKGCVLQSTWTHFRDRFPFTASRIFSIPQELYQSKRWKCETGGFLNRAVSHQLEFHTDSRSVTHQWLQPKVGLLIIKIPRHIPQNLWALSH